MPECIVVRCEQKSCMRFQRTYSVLPSDSDYFTCKWCEMRQPVKAFIDPRTSKPLRGYNHDWLAEQVQELKKKMSLHGHPGHPSYERRKQNASQLSIGKGASKSGAGVQGSKGSFAKSLFVPDSAQVGDEIEIKAGGRTLRCIIQAVE